MSRPINETAFRPMIYSINFRMLTEDHDRCAEDNSSVKVNAVLLGTSHHVPWHRNDNYLHYDMFESHDINNIITILGEALKAGAYALVNLLCSTILSQ